MLDIVVLGRINQASEWYRAVEVKVHAILSHKQFVQAPRALSQGKVGYSALFTHIMTLTPKAVTLKFNAITE